jgi:hypothetical protein
MVSAVVFSKLAAGCGGMGGAACAPATGPSEPRKTRHTIKLKTILNPLIIAYLLYRLVAKLNAILFDRKKNKGLNAIPHNNEIAHYEQHAASIVLPVASVSLDQRICTAQQ